MNKTTRLAWAGTCVAAALLLSACQQAQTPAPDAAAPAPAAAEAVPVPAPAPTATPAVEVGADYPVARDACLAAVAEKAGVAKDTLVATEVLWAQAGVGVAVQVPGADAPWSCLSDEAGHVQGAAYTGSEGKL